jgi:hypothetical protein
LELRTQTESSELITTRAARKIAPLVVFRPTDEGSGRLSSDSEMLDQAYSERGGSAALAAPGGSRRRSVIGPAGLGQ